jgi:hypothetical protein
VTADACPTQGFNILLRFAELSVVIRHDLGPVAPGIQKVEEPTKQGFNLSFGQSEIEYFRLRNPARSGRLTSIRPNEPEAAQFGLCVPKRAPRVATRCGIVIRVKYYILRFAAIFDHGSASLRQHRQPRLQPQLLIPGP